MPEIIAGMVRKERLELSRVTPLEPKSSASTSSATLAMKHPPTPLRHTGLAGEACHGGDEAGEGEDGGPCRIRTYDQLIKSQLLYQLS